MFSVLWLCRHRPPIKWTQHPLRPYRCLQNKRPPVLHATQFVTPSPRTFLHQASPALSAQPCKKNARFCQGMSRKSIASVCRRKTLRISLVTLTSSDGRLFCKHLSKNSTLEWHSLVKTGTPDDQNLRPEAQIYLHML